MMTPTKTYNIYSDHLNTPRRVTDGTNKTVWKWESTPFGETAPTGSLEFNLRFAGQYYDKERGTHYNINRDYSPVTGRYIQSDPIGLDGGFSTFAYVSGNPVMRIDVNGLVDMNFIPYSGMPGSLYLASKNYNTQNWFTVAAHGHDYGAMDYANNYEIVEEGLDEIASKAKASGKRGIWLIVCHGGVGEKRYTLDRKDVSLPEYLNKKSGMPVKATSDYVIFGGFQVIPKALNGKWDIWGSL
jgi:RHS repeat-associated protein